MPASESDADTFQVLCYHDVRDDVQGHYDPDSMAVSTRRLIEHFAWLKGHGWHPVSIDDLIDARKGIKKLPEKAILITFDDGLKSIYTKVYPILKLFNYPAVVALMGKWLERGKGLSVKYGHKDLSEDDFLTWEQIQELDRSGLVEFASHSYDLHRGVLANPQGNVQPAPAARVYDPAARSYEDDEAYEKRIHSDLEKSVQTIKKQLGKGPRVMVWPYGKYNRSAAEIARSLGMSINLTLEPKINRVDHLEFVGRALMSHNPELDQFIWELRYAAQDTDPVRVVHVDLDYLYDQDKVQQARNLDLLLERIKQMKINRVFLQAFADEDGDGTAHALYFPNRRLPVKADLFNRVAWQLKTRSEVKVYAWMPVTAFDFPPEKSFAYVTGRGNKNTTPGYKRLSIFDPAARTVILEIYEDLAKHADFDGLLFHDDAYLSDFEDAGQQALEYYKTRWNLPPDIKRIRHNPEFFKTWSAKKTEFLIEFTQEIKERVQLYRAPVKTARNIYARPVMEPESETWFAQSYPLFLKHYDYTAVMAMPYMEKAKRPHRWLTRLVKKALLIDPGLEKTIFELQARDWRTQKDIPVRVLLKQMEILQLNRALNYGYYPDDFIRGRPDLEEIRKGISLQTYPYRKK
jgi:biofilm PGA synthesis lipoprotein PgaB